LLYQQRLWGCELLFNCTRGSGVTYDYRVTEQRLPRSAQSSRQAIGRLKFATVLI
jgi:hypothetical protein